MTGRVAAVAAALCLLMPAAAHAARPAYVADVADLPVDVTAARAVLDERMARAAPGSPTRRDLAWVRRLAVRYLDSPSVPAGRRATVAKAVVLNAWWFSRRPSPSERIVVRDPDGVIATYWEGHGLMVNPVATAGRWQGLNDAFRPEALADALLPLGVRRAVGGRPALVWEYYDVRTAPSAIRPGLSGMAQSRIAQLMARAYKRTGEERFARAAADALVPFLTPVARGGVTTMVAAPGVPRSAWYAERAYPGADPWTGAALNGFMAAVLDLRLTGEQLASRPPRRAGGAFRVAAAGGEPRRPDAARRGERIAEGLAARGAATLRRLVPLHDTGRWSVYGMRTPGYRWGTHLADLPYHCYHVRLLTSLGEAYPGMGFTRVARRWSGYVAARGLRCPGPAATRGE